MRKRAILAIVALFMMLLGSDFDGSSLPPDYSAETEPGQIELINQEQDPETAGAADEEPTEPDYRIGFV